MSPGVQSCIIRCSSSKQSLQQSYWTIYYEVIKAASINRVQSCIIRLYDYVIKKVSLSCESEITSAHLFMCVYMRACVRACVRACACACACAFHLHIYSACKSVRLSLISKMIFEKIDQSLKRFI